jgi:hypothetical protein
MLLLGLSMACSSKSSQVWTAGRQLECACPGGGAGAQVCMANGRGFEPCQCQAKPVERTDSPATTETIHKDIDGTTDVPHRSAKGLVPCPGDAIALAMRLAPVSLDDMEESSAKCTAGFFPDPGWVVVFRRALAFERLVINATTRAIVARGEPEGLSGGSGVEVVRLATIDFDGDGTSEILYEYRYDSHGYWVVSLQAFQISGSTLVSVLDTTLEAFNDGAAPEPGQEYAYKASYKLTQEIDGTRGVDVTGAMVKGNRSNLDGDVVIGTARFRWAGGQLARR